MKKRMLAIVVSSLCLSMALMFGCSPSQGGSAENQDGTAMAQTGESGDAAAGKDLLQKRCDICHTYPQAESFSPMTIDEAKAFLGTHEGGLLDEEEADNVIAYLQS